MVNRVKNAQQHRKLHAYNIKHKINFDDKGQYKGNYKGRHFIPDFNKLIKTGKTPEVPRTTYKGRHFIPDFHELVKAGEAPVIPKSPYKGRHFIPDFQELIKAGKAPATNYKGKHFDPNYHLRFRKNVDVPTDVTSVFNAYAKPKNDPVTSNFTSTKNNNRVNITKPINKPTHAKKTT